MSAKPTREENPSLQPRRRALLQAGAAMTLAAASVVQPGAQPIIMNSSSELMPRSGKRRVVILGGGWGGMTTARHVREQAPDLEVVLIERNPVFWSCPLSNKWLIDVVDTNFLVHSYMAPARRFGYTFVQAEITEVDRAKRRVHTTQGHVDYDWLVISAGIRYGFEAWFGNDRKAIEYTRTNYATAYIPSAEHALVKQKIHNFKGGTFVMTLPPPPHRCPPSPYERACLMAWLYQTRKINAKIIILDPKPNIAPITAGYAQAFKELYPDTITHVPKAVIKEVDPFNKVVKTAAGDFKFDDALLMSPHQAADLVWKADLIGKTPEGRPTGWAGVHPLYYNAPNDPQVFVIGDSMGAVSPHFGHYPKAGHVANRQGRSVARYIAMQAKGEALKPIIIDNLCYMLVNNNPREAIAVQFDYKIGEDGLLRQTQIDDSERREELWKEDLRWVDIMYKDFATG